MSLIARCMRARQLVSRSTIKLFAPATQITRVSSTSTRPDSDKDKDKDEKPKEYVVKFMPGIDVKKMFKELYSHYGPIFVGCHIGVSLISLGFFTSLIYFSVDVTKIIPETLIQMAGQKVAVMTGEGGKFVLAYALHKVIFPFRMGISILVTKFLSERIKQRGLKK